MSTQSNKKRVLKRLKGQNNEEAVIEKDKCIYFKKYDLRVELLHCQTDKKGQQYTANLMFKLDSNELDEPIFEPSTAIAVSCEEALDKAADQFISVMLSFVLSFQCDEMDCLKNSFDDREHIYHYPCTLPVSLVGTAKGRSKKPFEIVKNELSNYLGARKYNWVKLFVGRVGEKIDCEAKVNGIDIPELSDMLKVHAGNDEDKKPF